jgi:hypothetical protein
MKRLILLVLVLGFVIAPAAEALQWKSVAVLRVTSRPVGDDFRVTARGVHRVLVTSVAVWEKTFPLRIRIDYGDLLQDGVPMRTCGTGWTWVADRESITCSTRYTQEPCEDGIWDAATMGRLEGHPQGGQKFDMDRPVVIDCACL